MFAVERLPLAERYVAWLADAGVVRGLIGPREVERLWIRHVVNSAVLEEQVAEGARVCDVGSGAGLPGIPLAIARPDVQVTLLEPLLRRATFLQEVVDDLGLDGVRVVRGRAEDWTSDERFDVVTARAVAPLTRLLGWCLPLVGDGGAVLAIKGSAAEDEVAQAQDVLDAWGCGTPAVVELGVSRTSEPTRAVRVEPTRRPPVSLPAAREAGRPGGRRGSRRPTGRRGRRR